jgi:hypothetical protein
MATCGSEREERFLSAGVRGRGRAPVRDVYAAPRGTLISATLKWPKVGRGKLLDGSDSEAVDITDSQINIAAGKEIPALI